MTEIVTDNLLIIEVTVVFDMTVSVRHGYPWVPTDQAHGHP
jgi:hypothetical protein